MTDLDLRVVDSLVEIGGHEARRPRRPRWRWVAVCVAIVVVLAAGLVGVRMWLTAPARPISVKETVDNFRAESDHPNGPTTTTAAQLRPLVDGVYAYDTSGQESIDALGGDTHAYPSESAMTVVAEGCGYRITWAPLAGRLETSLLCGRDGGLAIEQSTTAHEFLRQSDTETFTCDVGAWWLPPPGITAWTATCRTSERVSTRSGRVVATETIVVGGERRDVVHVRYDDVLSAGSSGSTTSDLWLDPSTGLVLKQHNEADTRNDSPIGSVTFREKLDLTLQSMTPQR